MQPPGYNSVIKTIFNITLYFRIVSASLIISFVEVYAV